MTVTSGCRIVGDVRDVDHVVGQLGRLRSSPSLAMAIIGPPRALISSMLRDHLVIHGPLRHDEHARRVSSTRAIGPCFISAAG